MNRTLFQPQSLGAGYVIFPGVQWDAWHGDVLGTGTFGHATVHVDGKPKRWKASQTKFGIYRRPWKESWRHFKCAEEAPLWHSLLDMYLVHLKLSSSSKYWQIWSGLATVDRCGAMMAGWGLYIACLAQALDCPSPRREEAGPLCKLTDFGSAFAPLYPPHGAKWSRVPTTNPRQAGAIGAVAYELLAEYKMYCGDGGAGCIYTCMVRGVGGGQALHISQAPPSGAPPKVDRVFLDVFQGSS